MGKSLGVIVVVLAVAAGVGFAIGQGTTTTERGYPVPWIAAVISFVVQWVVFVPSFIKQTEHYYDLTGSLTYLTVVWFCVLAGPMDTRGLVIAVCVTLWAGRLGSFLFRRVKKSGGDGRFDEIKPSFGRFLVAWTLQGLWVFLTLAAAIAAITAGEPPTVGVVDAIGLAVWILGFGIEVVADRQKSAFREKHPGEFITTGLWAWSRHPNYFGEIVLWVGVAIMASSTLEGWQWVAWISPVFVYVLLTRISGVPILERRSDERWGGDEAYEGYKAKTPVLLLRPPS